MKAITIAALVLWGLVFIPFMPLQASNNENGAKLEFVKEFEDLGEMNVNELELMKRTIEFTNSGDEPLVVTHVRGCCGTRVTDYTRSPVMPGEKGKIDIQFRLAPRAHRVSRTVSVVSNDAEGMKVYRLRGEVIDAKPEFGSNSNDNAMVPRNN